jgi:small-conductance mechanosensitive channel
VIDLMNQLHIPSMVYAALLVLAGYFFAKLVSVNVAKSVAKRISPHRTMLLRRSIFYLILALFIVIAFQQLGFEVGALLGAAGILTAAIGFASQTSMSNLISGLFILGEQPFEMGDTIRINDIQGEVVSIGLISVRIRTSDNIMVRIPNETLIKTAVTNLSFFPLRRIDLKIGISHHENIQRVKTLFFEIAAKTPLCLIDPKPSLQVQNFWDTSVELQFSVWANQSDFNEVKNYLQEEILQIFAGQEIKIPFSKHLVALEKENKET